MYSPIIVFNPTGLTDEQVKMVKAALDSAYEAGYKTAEEFYKIKINDLNTITAPSIGLQGIGYPNQDGKWGVINCSCNSGPLTNGTMSY